jgi:hypothetical protein
MQEIQSEKKNLFSMRDLKNIRNIKKNKKMRIIEKKRIYNENGFLIEVYIENGKIIDIDSKSKVTCANKLNTQKMRKKTKNIKMEEVEKTLTMSEKLEFDQTESDYSDNDLNFNSNKNKNKNYNIFKITNENFNFCVSNFVICKVNSFSFYSNYFKKFKENEAKRSIFIPEFLNDKNNTFFENPFADLYFDNRKLCDLEGICSNNRRSSHTSLNQHSTYEI